MPGDVIETPISFHSGATALAGIVLRDTGDTTVRQPAVIVTGSWLTVKEQMPLVYARRLAALCYTAFISDFFELIQQGGSWRISAVAMTPAWQWGNRDLPRLAGERAARDP